MKILNTIWRLIAWCFVDVTSDELFTDPSLLQASEDIRLTNKLADLQASLVNQRRFAKQVFAIDLQSVARQYLAKRRCDQQRERYVSIHGRLSELGRDIVTQPPRYGKPGQIVVPSWSTVMVERQPIQQCCQSFLARCRVERRRRSFRRAFGKHGGRTLEGLQAHIRGALQRKKLPATEPERLVELVSPAIVEATMNQIGRMIPFVPTITPSRLYKDLQRNIGSLGLGTLRRSTSLAIAPLSHWVLTPEIKALPYDMVAINRHGIAVIDVTKSLRFLKSTGGLAPRNPLLTFTIDMGKYYMYLPNVSAISRVGRGDFWEKTDLEGLDLQPCLEFKDNIHRAIDWQSHI